MLGTREFTNSIDRIVIVKRQQVVTIRSKRICFAHQFKCLRGVRCENGNILAFRRIEVGQDFAPASLDEVCYSSRSGIS